MTLEKAAATEQKDELKMSKADTGKPSGETARAARGDYKARRERALQEAQSRVAELQKNISDLQKFAELKNRQLAELQEMPAAKQAAPGAPSVAAPPTPAAAPPAPTPAPPPPPFVSPSIYWAVFFAGLAIVLITIFAVVFWKRGGEYDEFQQTILRASFGLGAACIVFPIAGKFSISVGGDSPAEQAGIHAVGPLSVFLAILFYPQLAAMMMRSADATENPLDGGSSPDTKP